MAESDRQRLLERALALPQAHASDFSGGRRAPGDADAELLKRINDTSLRTKLIEVRLAEGLQSPKGPQKIASIVRIYPNFDAPPSNGRRPAIQPVAPATQRGLATVDEMERLIARIRATEREVEGELSAQVNERVEHLKRALAESSGDELETAYRELGDALERKRALASQIRSETFRRIEDDAAFSPRTYLRFIRR